MTINGVVKITCYLEVIEDNTQQRSRDNIRIMWKVLIHVNGDFHAKGNRKS